LRGEDEGGGDFIPLTLTLSLRGEREMFEIIGKLVKRYLKFKLNSFYT
jgi:hypothetical protein